jgi:hypothetical protein
MFTGAPSAIVEEPEVDCESSKEVITTYNFLMETKEIEVKSAQAVPIAAGVAKGCSGAAKRFIGVVLLLNKAKLAADSIVKIATAVAQGTDEGADAFGLVFRLSYLKSGLDLDALAALQLAKSLSVEYPGNPKQAEDDFSKVVDFCLSSTGLALSRPQCATLAARVAFFGLKSEDGVAKDYVEVIEQLTSKAGANLATMDARVIAEALLEVSPFASKNFLETYRFAISERGFQMNRKDAVNFAKSIASYKFKKPGPKIAKATEDKEAESNKPLIKK